MTKPNDSENNDIEQKTPAILNRILKPTSEYIIPYLIQESFQFLYPFYHHAARNKGCSVLYIVIFLCHFLLFSQVVIYPNFLVPDICVFVYFLCWGSIHADIKFHENRARALFRMTKVN